MKKRVRIWALCVAVCLTLVGCGAGQPEETKPALERGGFEDMIWVRDTESCIETLCFRSDGSCSYYCACGNPVNDDDLCEGYRYDAESKSILLEFLETTEETVTEIRVERFDGTTLVLDFDGDVRTFQLETES